MIPHCSLHNKGHIRPLLRINLVSEPFSRIGQSHIREGNARTVVILFWVVAEKIIWAITTKFSRIQSTLPLQYSGSDSSYYLFIFVNQFNNYTHFRHNTHTQCTEFCFLALRFCDNRIFWEICCVIFVVVIGLLNMDIEERLGLMEESMRRIMEESMRQMRRGMTGLVRHNQIDRTPNPNLRNHEDRLMKIDIPEFDGNSYDPTTYLDWEGRMDQYFEFKETPPHQQLNWLKSI